MDGGDGDDTHVVDSTSDVVTESSSEGTVLIQASVTCTAHYNIVQLTLTGSGHINDNCQRVADGECPKIRELLAEALVPVLWLEAGQHLQGNGDRCPGDKDVVGTSAEMTDFQQPRLGPPSNKPAGPTAPPTAEEIRKSSSSAWIPRQQTSLVLKDTKPCKKNSSNGRLTEKNNHFQWGHYFTSLKVATIEGNIQYCAHRHSL